MKINERNEFKNSNESSEFMKFNERNECHKKILYKKTNIFYEFSHLIFISQFIHIVEYNYFFNNQYN